MIGTQSVAEIYKLIIRCPRDALVSVESNPFVQKPLVGIIGAHFVKDTLMVAFFIDA